METVLLNNNIDDEVDNQIYQCLDPNNPKSFFLFAGAGSGKTRSLVNVLDRFKKEYGRKFKLHNQKIGIITYTNAAADEIRHRLEYDQIFYVSTIHSFAWEIIKSYTSDIKKWLKENLRNEIIDLQEAQSRSKDSNNKTSIDRARKIESKEKRLEYIEKVSRFIYNPNGDNVSNDSLNHSEVISITASFIQSKMLMQEIIVSKFPIILIDESQDTRKELIEAFFSLQEIKKNRFVLGLFGDTMQRIYADGKDGLESNLPSDWLKPEKQMNHRSNKRIIKLINNIRKDVDNQKQIPRTEKQEGFVRLFICNRTSFKTEVENNVAYKMSILTKDKEWNFDNGNIKTLILEHHMAAKRMNFLGLFEPLYKVDKLKTGFLNGSLSTLNLFSNIILPIIEAHKSNDKFSIARILKKHSPLLDKNLIKESSNQIQNIKTANESVDKLLSLWKGNNDPKLIEILEVIRDTSLFHIPSIFNIILSRTKEEKEIIKSTTPNDENLVENTDEIIDSWDIALQTNYSQIESYNNYISESSSFATHQGVKGLEYARVMLIIDDEEAKGFMFSYDKLFGSKDLSASDIRNIQEGKETSIERTRRLFYVACSRAKESLAIIAYTDNPEILKENALKYSWFDETEIEIIKI